VHRDTALTTVTTGEFPLSHQKAGTILPHNKNGVGDNIVDILLSEENGWNSRRKKKKNNHRGTRD
jgi:hypothetical protein